MVDFVLRKIVSKKKLFLKVQYKLYTQTLDHHAVVMLHITLKKKTSTKLV